MAVFGVGIAQAGGSGNETITAQADEKKQSCKNVHKAIEHYQKKTWKWQMKFGTPKTEAREIAGSACEYAQWVAKTWRTRAQEAQNIYETWVAKRTIPTTGDWFTAVMISQRVFPKTAGWLLSCSKHEGGHGGFVMNRQGSGAGGWMQFMSSTYYANHDDAQRYVKSHGFIVDSRVWTWTHPLGQALTAAYMRAVQGTSHLHWAPSIDPYCY